MSSIEPVFKGLAIPVKGVVSGDQGTDCDLARSLSFSVGLHLFIVCDVIEVKQDASAKYGSRFFGRFGRGYCDSLLGKGNC